MRNYGILLLAFMALAVTQCVSPLDPDTPRKFTPDEIDDVVDPPPPHRLRLKFAMNGSLSQEIGPDESWPKLATAPDSQFCFVDTSVSSGRFTIHVSYERPGRPEEIPGEKMHLYAIRLKIDSADLLESNNAPDLLTGSPEQDRNFIEFQVVYLLPGTQEKRRITVSGDGATSDASVSLKEVAIRSFKKLPPGSEKAYTMELFCIFDAQRNGSHEKYTFNGLIALKYD